MRLWGSYEPHMSHAQLYKSPEAAIRALKRQDAEKLLREMIKLYPNDCNGASPAHCQICCASVLYGKRCTSGPLDERMAFAREQLNRITIGERLTLI